MSIEDWTTYPNIRRGLFGTLLINHLISREESQSVGVVFESLNDPKDLLEVFGIVAAFGVRSIEAITFQRRVDVQNHVDSGSVEDRRTFVVVELRREVVDTDSVDLVSDISTLSFSSPVG